MEVDDGEGALRGRRGEQLIEGKLRQINPNFSELEELLRQWITPILRKDSWRR